MHPLDRAVASDLSLEVLKLRMRRYELRTPEPDNRLRQLYPVTVGVERHAYLADRDTARDTLRVQR